MMPGNKQVNLNKEVLKPENFGEQMSVEEKMIDEEFYTVMTNRPTGKIALLAETPYCD